MTHEQLNRDLFEAIKHGDEEHQRWLRDKLTEFFQARRSPNEAGGRGEDSSLTVGNPRPVPSAAKRIDALEVALRDLLEICKHATFDNGVFSEDGRSEADYWASGSLDAARALLRETDDAPLPDFNSVTSCRLKSRLDFLLERAGSVDLAVTGPGVGISYLFARQIYRDLIDGASPAPVSVRHDKEEE